MNSLEILKKLKEIAPERYYAERSRAQILATEQPRRLSPWKIFAESMEAGSAMVLAGALLILILGGFSGINVLNIASLNPTSLKAEADAIDMQIQLTDLSYQNFTRVVASKKESVSPLSAFSLMALEDNATTTTSTVVGIDDALRALSE
ncbi:MAG: hypothetical protein LiPW15_470 [Parcubacteria group bacterium LiPW_15]|nr:MAG: hypothetical protein LiPW15_470 [Parcubacteria group bacterium LiPW_15]